MKASPETPSETHGLSAPAGRSTVVDDGPGIECKDSFQSETNFEKARAQLPTFFDAILPSPKQRAAAIASAMRYLLDANARPVLIPVPGSQSLSKCLRDQVVLKFLPFKSCPSRCGGRCGCCCSWLLRY